MPDRSFHIDGEKFGVCSRCFGVYFGLFFGFVIYPLWRRIDEIEPISRIWLFLSLIPIGVDWSLTIFGIWENTFTIEVHHRPYTWASRVPRLSCRPRSRSREISHTAHE